MATLAKTLGKLSTQEEREQFFTDKTDVTPWDKVNALTQPMNDPVNHPNHYTKTKPETIDMIEAILTPAEFKGYCKGNIIKYRDRAGHKDNAQQDYDKAKWYYMKLKGREND